MHLEIFYSSFLIFFFFPFFEKKIVCYQDCSSNGNRTCLVTSARMQVKLLGFSCPQISMQFYVLWVEFCAHGDLPALFSFCYQSLKLLSFLKRFVFTSLLL